MIYDMVNVIGQSAFIEMINKIVYEISKDTWESELFSRSIQ